MSDTDPTLPESDDTTTTTESPPTTDTTLPGGGVAPEDDELGDDELGGDEPEGEIDDATSTVEGSAPTTRSLSDRGIGVDLPPGWEGEIYRRTNEEVTFDESVPRSRRIQPTTRSVAHLASFPLPPDRGDYGSGAVEIMRDDDVLVILFEFEPESATEVMFAESGLPHPLEPDDFGPNQMQRPLEGMAGVQKFFNVDEERSFCLFVVIGSYARRRALVARVNDVLATITIGS